MPQETISLIALPQGEIGEQVAKTIRLWYRFGLVENGLFIPAEELSEEKVRNFEICASQISDQESLFPLFQFLGETSYVRRDLVVPWYIGDNEPSLDLAKVGALLAEQIRLSITRVVDSSSSGETFFSTLLSIPSYSETKPKDIRSGEFYFDQYDLNAMASSEVKASPGASSIPVKQGWASFVPFVSAQIITAAGLWMGNQHPLSKIVGTLGSPLRKGEGKVIVFRSMTSAVVARDLARKMVSQALMDAANPEKSSYFGGENRPISLSEGAGSFVDTELIPEIAITASSTTQDREGIGTAKELPIEDINNSTMFENTPQSDVFYKKEKKNFFGISKKNIVTSTQNDIDRSIEIVANKIMKGFETSFNYERTPELQHRDFDRGAKEVLKIFWNFTLATLKSMPYYTRLWFDKKFAKILDKLFGYVRQIKERYFGHEEELLEKIQKINDLRSDSRKLDNLVLASTVFEENSRLWKNLRNQAFASLDFGIEDSVGSQGRVFPHFKYVTTDPDAHYLFDNKASVLLGVEQRVTFNQSHDVRGKILLALNENTSKIDNLRKRLEELRKPVPLIHSAEAQAEVPQGSSDNTTHESTESESSLDEERPESVQNPNLPQIVFNGESIEEETPNTEEEAFVHAPKILDPKYSPHENSPDNNVPPVPKQESSPEAKEEDTLSRLLQFGEDEDKK